MIVCVPITDGGMIGPSWGRAPSVAIADVHEDDIRSWHELDVGWDRLHDEGTEGSHHARIARFIREHEVEAVVAEHMGPPMENMLGKLEVAVQLGVIRLSRRRGTPRRSRLTPAAAGSARVQLRLQVPADRERSA